MLPLVEEAVELDAQRIYDLEEQDLEMADGWGL